MDPILQEFPERIETERLYMRPALPGDGKTVHEAVSASAAELKQWLPFAQHKQSAVEVESGIRNSYAKFIQREDFRIHIYRKEDDVFVGSTGLHRIDWNVRKFEIGYWGDVRFRKNGYISEAAAALTKFAFEHFQANRVEIRCDPKNISSRRIPEKLGYTLEGVLVNDSLSADGKELRNTCVYAKVSS
ncbi:MULTISPECIES: GNAT family N-acetyltransferase [Cytobacillus]|uniref:GNAT family N-acetyltransferase n=1 Tax=Cytobacillus TaxID=2675230 RepID=UPI00203CC111|nr:GNAT family N-acetyltransferase [Cytobacillus firmus]MCM3707759.1 GNAT family N-acetyltransferase [Cytobacillus firmus]